MKAGIASNLAKHTQSIFLPVKSDGGPTLRIESGFLFCDLSDSRRNINSLNLRYTSVVGIMLENLYIKYREVRKSLLEWLYEMEDHIFHLDSRVSRREFC